MLTQKEKQGRKYAPRLPAHQGDPAYVGEIAVPMHG
jgi:hypothetical protein